MADPQPTWKGRLVALIVGCLILVPVSEIVMRAVYPAWDEFYAGRFLTVEHVPGFGDVAVGRAGFDGYFAQNNGDFRAHIKVNDFGLRNSDPVDAADGRIWIIGDSMAFGWGVEGDEMYSAEIGEILNAPTYNVASPGTNVCGYQALTARMPDDVAPSGVIVGLIIENDLTTYDCKAAAKSESRTKSGGGSGAGLRGIKQFLTENSALYNFFAVSLKRVDVVREALIWLGAVDKSHAYSDRYADRDMQPVLAATAHELARLRDMFDPETPFAVLIAPARFEIAGGDDLYAGIRQQLHAALAAEDLAYIDPIDGFEREGFAATHFAHDGHWSADGHRVAAEAAADWLTKNVD